MNNRARQITFDQFLDDSGISKQDNYCIRVINSIYKAFERSGWKCPYGPLIDAPMDYIIDFLRSTNFGDKNIWRGFGYKTANVLFGCIFKMFDIELRPKYALEKGQQKGKQASLIFAMEAKRISIKL